MEYEETSSILKDSSNDVKAESSCGDEAVDEVDCYDQEPVSKSGWSSAIYIMVSEVAERFAQYGIASNLVVYLTGQLKESLIDAVGNYYTFGGFSALLPLLGAFIADSYTGRYRTIVYSSFIYILGLISLTISAGFVPDHYRKLCYYISLYVVVVGQAGFKPCVQAFAADQFNDESEKDRKAKNSFFNWWFFCIMGGASAATIIVSYVQEGIGWWVGYCIVSVSMIVAFFIFISGKKLYRPHIPGGSPLTSILKVLVAAARKRHLSSMDDKQRVYGGVEDVLQGRKSLPHTNQYRFLDKATIIDEIDASTEVKNSWRLSTVTQVEEVKMVIRVLPIWFSTLMFFLVIVQPASFFIKQSATMNRQVSSLKLTPAASVVSVGLFAVITVPLYDWLFVPLARRITNIPSGITVLQRTGAGLLISVFNMVVAALVETKRLRVAREHGLADQPNAEIPMTVMWLLPQCMLIGVSDIFGLVGIQQFFYEQVPDGMKSLGSAVYLSALGMGSFICHFVVFMVAKLFPEWLHDNLNTSRLDNYYWLLAGLSLVWFGIFLIVSKNYVYRGTGATPQLVHDDEAMQISFVALFKLCKRISKAKGGSLLASEF
ncbi:protein NRT1/ PTR FAMILY 5.4-like [Aristolochia californica]|uniref:protein NRT1/ PTR FAMILY 5.4-like n=1 Tax=Aristolochia californica TaxID=171875 RepID=UPI0035E07367